MLTDEESTKLNAEYVSGHVSVNGVAREKPLKTSESVSNFLKSMLARVESDIKSLHSSGIVARGNQILFKGSTYEFPFKSYYTDIGKRVEHPFCDVLSKLLIDKNPDGLDYWGDKDIGYLRGTLRWGSEKIAELDISDKYQPKLVLNLGQNQEESLARAQAVILAMDPIVKKTLKDLNMVLKDSSTQDFADLAWRKAILEGVDINKDPTYLMKMSAAKNKY